MRFSLVTKKYTFLETFETGQSMFSRLAKYNDLILNDRFFCGVVMRRFFYIPAPSGRRCFAECPPRAPLPLRKYFRLPTSHRYRGNFAEGTRAAFQTLPPAPLRRQFPLPDAGGCWSVRFPLRMTKAAKRYLQSAFPKGLSHASYPEAAYPAP